MKNTALINGLVANYPLPPDVPEPLVEAHERLSALGLEWGATKGTIDDLEQGRLNVRAENIKARAAALAAGDEPPADTSKQEAALEVKIAAVQRRRAELDNAVDLVGNDLARLLAEHRGPWIDRLRDREQDAAREYDEALVRARAAAADLGILRSAVLWLEGFDLNLAIVGQVRPWHGKGRGVIQGESQSALPGEYAIEDLLALAAKATEPPAPKPVYRGTRPEMSLV